MLRLTQDEETALARRGFAPFVRFEPGRKVRFYAKLCEGHVWTVELRRGEVMVTVGTKTHRSLLRMNVAKSEGLASLLDRCQRTLDHEAIDLRREAMG
jgi:hypothetical protein